MLTQSLCNRQQLEYKYIVRQSDGSTASWQPGENCAIKVPAGSGHRLQVIDDWLGKSRSVVYDDGEIGTPPHGTFDASMEIEEAQGDAEAAAQGSATESRDDTGADVLSSQPSSTQDVQSPDQQEPSASQSAPVVPEASSPEVSDPAEDSAQDDGSDQDLKGLTVKDLKDRLKTRGLPVSGRKAELIDRLTSSYSE